MIILFGGGGFFTTGRITSTDAALTIRVTGSQPPARSANGLASEQRADADENKAGGQ